MEKTIEIPFGAKDSELKGWEYTIPEDMEAEIKDGKIIVKQKESEDERIRKALIGHLKAGVDFVSNGVTKAECIAWLEKKKEQKPESCDCSRDEESYTNGIHHVLMNPEAYGLIKLKPAKWSEEEKMHFANAILAAEKEWGVNSYTARFLESLRDTFQNGNSRWKPSEEQMEAVEEALEFYSGTTDTAKGLRSLYNDLKKL